MKDGFTLAEILITLTIIGAVVAMTIPSFRELQQEKATISALKKAYSTLSNAYTRASDENCTPDNWGLSSGSEILNKLKPYLNIAKDCTDGSSGCFPAGVRYMYLNSVGSDSPYEGQAYPKLKLADGTLIMGYVASPTCNSSVGNALALKNLCGEFWVDINGYKKPNQFGRDLFKFYLTKYGIFPEGSEQETGSYTFANNCKDRSSHIGEACAAWVIYNENMDYLRCNTLNWTGPTTCP